MKLKPKAAVHHRVFLLFDNYDVFRNKIVEFVSDISIFIENNGQSNNSKDTYGEFLFEKALFLDENFLISHSDEEKKYAIKLLKRILESFPFRALYNTEENFPNFKVDVKYNYKYQKITIDINAPVSKKEFLKVFPRVQMFQEAFIKGNLIFDPNAAKNPWLFFSQPEFDKYFFNLKLKRMKPAQIKEYKGLLHELNQLTSELPKVKSLEFETIKFDIKKYKDVDKTYYSNPYNKNPKYKKIDELANKYNKLKSQILKKPIFKYTSNPQQFNEDFEILKISKQYENVDEAEEYYRKLKLKNSLKNKENQLDESEFASLSFRDLKLKYLKECKDFNVDKQIYAKDFKARLREIKQLYALD